jgi:hypothetical protein
MGLSFAKISLLALAFASLSAHSAPKDESRYDRISGGIYELESGMVVEGSVKHGGIQPDYQIDFESQDFRQLKKFARAIKDNPNLSIWTKIDKVATYIRNKTLPHGEYNNPNYLKTLASFREAGEDIPLSAYMSCRAGVCRENAMLLHLALKEAGIANRFVYAKVQQQVWERGVVTFDKSEDHAFTVVEINGKNWIADSYNSNFHGYNFDQLTNPDLDKSLRLEESPLVKDYDSSVFRRIRKVNSYPTVWKPKAVSCPGLYQNLQF